MLPHLFSHPLVLLSGAITGFIFGFLLQKGKVSQFSIIVGQFLGKDFTVIKIMITTIIVGGVGIYALLAFDLPISLHIKEGTFTALASGGMILGAGMAILGYCPGTCVAAAGQGSKDAWWGLLGMLSGAAVYTYMYPWLHKTIHTHGKKITTTLSNQLSISPWIIFTVLAILVFIVIPMIKKKTT